MMTTSKKKPKTASDNDDFETVKRYILDCPHVNANHPAIKAAIEGIEKEQARIERDSKLQRKFAGGATINTTATAASASPATTPNNNLSESMVVVDKYSAGEPSASPSIESSSDKDMQEWQDVSKSKEDGDDDVVCGNGIGDSSSSDGGTSFLGKQLSKVAIDSIAQYQVKVKSPMAAIAAVLHASLRSEILGFKCTGIPEDASKSSGFAPPVRELPNNVFLPPNWDTITANSSIALRYRKDGTGATILRVQSDDSDPHHGSVKISFQPATSKEPSSLYLSFAIDDHINLDSWNAAMKVSAVVSPALHYKSLSELLSNFSRTFDLGTVGNFTDQSSETPYVDNTVLPSFQNGQSPPQVGHKSDFVPGYVPGIAVEDRRKKPWQDGIGVPATLDQAFPNGRPVPLGDFQGDITPGGGLVDPRFAGSQPPVNMPGNQMGPNHPMFSGTDGIRGPTSIGPPVGGPGSMQPRFDPYYPPGVDIDIDGRPTRRPHQNNRPSRTGLPNPDHLPPPNSFGNDMYM